MIYKKQKELDDAIEELKQFRAMNSYAFFQSYAFNRRIESESSRAAGNGEEPKCIDQTLAATPEIGLEKIVPESMQCLY